MSPDVRIPAPWTMGQRTLDQLMEEMWLAVRGVGESDDEFYARLMKASWDGLAGRRYSVPQSSTSGMGPMPEWLKEEGDQKLWMRPDAVWGAWCNVCLDGVVGLYEVTQYWFTNHCQGHHARPENDWETAYEKAEWELRTIGHVTHATVDGLMKRIRRLEHRLRGSEVGALLKETTNGSEEVGTDTGEDRSPRVG